MKLHLLLPLSLIPLVSSPAWLSAASDSAELEMDVISPAFVGPQQLEPIDAVIPSQFIYLDFQFREVKAKVQLDSNGKVADYVVLQAPHRHLLKASESVLQEIRMTPAKENGKAVPVIIDVDFSFRYPAIAGRSVSDDLLRVTERPITDPQFVQSKPNELDAPLSVAARGEVYKPGDGSTPGNAVVEFYIDHTGKVRLPRVISSSSNEAAEAAVLTFLSFTFNPPTRKNQPTVVKVRMPYTWEVSEGASN